MASVIRMPKLGLTMVEGKVVAWLKDINEPVEKGEPVVEVSTEKITNTIEAPEAGVIRKILVEEGEDVEVGAPLGIIAEQDEDITGLEDLKDGDIKNDEVESSENEIEQKTEKEEVKTKPHKEISKEQLVSPMARKLAEEHGIDISQVEGSGPGGRVMKKDIQDYIKNNKQDKIKKIKMTDNRKIIAKKMYESLQTTAQLTFVSEIDVTQLVSFHKEIGKKQGYTYTDYLVKIVASVLKKFAECNATVEDDQIVMWQDINIGIAVDLKDDLIVPVIHNCDRLNLKQIAEKRKDLVSRAKERQLRSEEVTGGTFTISNLGMMDIDVFTPILNIPESAILGVCRIIEKFEPEDGKPVVKQKMNLCITVDHRIIDGAKAAAFLQETGRLLKEARTILNEE